MARPLRIEFDNALYHVTARGDRREPIFEDGRDRESLLNVVAQGLVRFDAVMWAYCLMGNHYHFVLQTRRANLSALMKHINGVYTQRFNRRHGKTGHVFQGRFKAILVDGDAYLLEVCRYVELNPVRAGLVAAPGDWPWSSYRAHVGMDGAPDWLNLAGVHGHLLGHAPQTLADHERAAKAYAALVACAVDVRLWHSGALRQQVFLGDEAFVARMQAQVSPQRVVEREIPRQQRLKTLPFAHWQLQCGSREEALWHAHVHGGLSMTQLACELGLSVSRVSRMIGKTEARAEEAKGKT